MKNVIKKGNAKEKRENGIENVNENENGSGRGAYSLKW